MSASLSARTVALARREFERPPAPFGDPTAEERLAQDLAADGRAPELSEAMQRYLRGRTRAFDRTVLGALERGTRQIVLLGAGYDGRALRYARPGIDFWEVDLPDTQRDKRERLDRLGGPPDPGP